MGRARRRHRIVRTSFVRFFSRVLAPLVDVFLPELFVEVLYRLVKAEGLLHVLFVSNRPEVTLVSNEIPLLETPEDSSDGVLLYASTVRDFGGQKRLVVVRYL